MRRDLRYSTPIVRFVGKESNDLCSRAHAHERPNSQVDQRSPLEASDAGLSAWREVARLSLISRPSPWRVGIHGRSEFRPSLTTAAVRDLTLVTADARLLKIAGIKLLT